jgi:hypothetical protein
VWVPVLQVNLMEMGGRCINAALLAAFAMVLTCWKCGAHRSCTRTLREHINSAHRDEFGNLINEAPGDWQYSYMTAEGQRARKRQKQRPKVCALCDGACALCNPN